jgi:hypothetical protein
VRSRYGKSTAYASPAEKTRSGSSSSSARAGSLDEATTQLRAAFERGLASYRARDLADARMHFETCVEIRPGDRPSAVFLERLADLDTSPPGTVWDGVWTLTSK